MACPDLERLIDFYSNPDADPEVDDHLESCPTCQADLTILRRIGEAYRAEIEVPESLVQRVLADLPDQAQSPVRHRTRHPQTVVTGLLGSLTATAAVLAVQSSADWTLSGLVLFALSVGAISVGLQGFSQVRHRRTLT